MVHDFRITACVYICSYSIFVFTLAFEELLLCSYIMYANCKLLVYNYVIIKLFKCRNRQNKTLQSSYNILSQLCYE